MENRKTRDSKKETLVSLSGMSTEDIKSDIVANPRDPRFRAAILELDKRGAHLDVPQIPDHTVEEAFAQDLFGEGHGVYGKMNWLRRTALQALSSLDTKEANDLGGAYEVLFKGVTWRFVLREGQWLLVSVTKNQRPENIADATEKLVKRKRLEEMCGLDDEVLAKMRDRKMKENQGD